MTKRWSVLLVVVLTGMFGVGVATAAPIPVSNSVPNRVANLVPIPTIYGPAVVVALSAVPVSGRVQPGAAVQIWFHRAGEPAGHYTLRRALTADAGGVYRTSYRADVDHRYYAVSGGRQSRILLTAVAVVTIQGPATIGLGSRVAITGTARPAGAAVSVYFHKAGEPAGYYTLRRHLVADASGRWSTSYVADADYRYYATVPYATSRVVLTQIARGWLATVNSYRGSYGVAAVTENAGLSAGDRLHVRYMYSTGQLAHSENPASPFFTAAGNAAAGRSNVAESSAPLGDVAFVDLWMNGPFHELGILRPRLRTTGFANGTGRFGTFAALDVLSDLAAPVPGGWPKSFPSAGSPFPFRTYGGNELPDPLSGCTSQFRQHPVSAPLIVSLGPTAAPVGSVSAVLTNTTTHAPVQVCVLTESTYTNSNPNWQSTGRAILGENHSIVVFGAGSLAAGSAYTLGVTPSRRGTTTVHFNTTP